MGPPGGGDAPILRDRAFLLLVVVVSLAFVWILWPLWGAILWGTSIAIVFAPLNRRLGRAFSGRRGLAALVTLIIVIVIVILPVTVVGAALIAEVAGAYERIKSGELNFGLYFEQVVLALPAWAVRLLDR